MGVVLPKKPFVFPGVQPCISPGAAVRCVLKIRQRLVCELGIEKKGPCCPDYLSPLIKSLRREDVVGHETVRVGDVGTVFEIVVIDENGPVNIQFSNTREFIFGKPSGFITRPAQFVTDGTDGRLFYVSVPGDLDEPGEWRLQARVEVPGVGIFKTETCTFFVEPGIDDVPPC
jgi:hypothetical protein